MTAPTEAAPPPEPGVRQYSLLCLAALGLLFLVLMLGLPPWARAYGLVPVVIGLLGVGLRWRLAPLALLLTLTALLTVVAQVADVTLRRVPISSSPATDLLLAAAVLAYVAGHYRLQALTQFIFPRDPRRPTAGPLARRAAGRPPAAPPPRRSPGRASSEELVQLLLVVPVCLLLAMLAFRLLVPREVPHDLFGDDWAATQEGPGASVLATAQLVAEALWRGRFLLWTLGAGALVVSGLLTYLAWRRRGPDEAVVFLQDVAWAETRGEQRRIDSWLVGARRRRRGKEMP